MRTNSLSALRSGREAKIIMDYDAECAIWGLRRTWVDLKDNFWAAQKQRGGESFHIGAMGHTELLELAQSFGEEQLEVF